MHLLTGSDQQNSESVDQLMQSYASDLIYGVTRGNVITAKHFILGLGLHNITGQKKPVEMNHHLGHSIDYKLYVRLKLHYPRLLGVEHCQLNLLQMM